jgi:hypothetical protein
MRPLIRLVFILVVLFFTALHLFAGNFPERSVDPSLAAIKNPVMSDSSLSVLTLSPETGKTAGKQTEEEGATTGSHICSCQILHLESSNFDHREVAVFAEKTNNGASADYAIAKSRIQKEKKILKKLFFDKVKVVAEIQSTGSCKSMFYRLKTANQQLQLYTILNADIY